MSDTFDITLTEGGAIKGKNCKVKSIEPIEGGNRMTFEWEEDNGTVLTDSMDVMNGEKGDTGETPDISMSATVNQTIGNPQVTITETGTKENPHFDIHLSGIKGEKGDIGITPDIDMTATVNQSIGTPSVEVSKSGTSQNPSFNFAIKNVKGEKGDTGLTPNLSATASVGNTVGTPSVSVSRSGSNENPKLNFSFNNLKGNTGATPNISASATVNQTVGNPSVEVSRSGTNENPSLAFNFSGLKGEKGDDGLDGFSARLPQTEYNPSDYLVVDDGTDAKKISVKDFVDNSNKDIWKAQGELGAKNLLSYPYNNVISLSSNGITLIINDDGSIIINGTATTTTYFVLTKQDFGEANFNSLAPSSIYTSSIGVETRDIYLSYNPSSKNVSLGISANTTVDNLTVYPMIRYTSDVDDTWQPYTRTNRELQSDILDVWKAQADTGVKNLLVHPYAEGNGTVRSGVTWTIDADGTVHANGTARGYSYFDLENFNTLILKAGDYILSMTDGDIPSNVRMICRNLSKTYGYANDPRYPLKFTVTEKEAEAYRNGTDKITVRVYVDSNSIVENAVIHPMLRKSVWEDASWVPYAKSNRELTEDVTVLKNKTSLPMPSKTQDANDTTGFELNSVNANTYSSQSANTPSATNYRIFTLKGGNDTYVNQLAVGAGGQKWYVRGMNNGVWGAWKRLIDEDELTALAARVTALENK